MADMKPPRLAPFPFYIIPYKDMSKVSNGTQMTLMRQITTD